MIVLSRSHPERRSVVFTSFLGLISCFFLFSYLAYYVEHLICNYKTFSAMDYFTFVLCIVLGCLIGCPIVLYFIGEIIWQVKGEEIIQYDENYLYIINKGRILGKTKKIRWNNIRNVELVKLSLYEQLIVHFSVQGDIDERLLISRYKGLKIYCGVNLSKDKCVEMVETLQELTNLKSRVPTP